MLAGLANGNMLPEAYIAKCGSAAADLSKTRIIQNLHKLPGFTVSDGWTLKFWSRELTLPSRKKDAPPETKKYIRPYIIHTSGTYITSQKKAWMDTPGICMWVDVLAGPFFKAKRGKGLNIWDNCGPHKTKAVLDVLAEWNLTERKLPPKMTGRPALLPRMCLRACYAGCGCTVQHSFATTHGLQSVL